MSTLVSKSYFIDCSLREALNLVCVIAFQPLAGSLNGRKENICTKRASFQWDPAICRLVKRRPFNGLEVTAYSLAGRGRFRVVGVISLDLITALCPGPAIIAVFNKSFLEYLGCNLRRKQYVVAVEIWETSTDVWPKIGEDR